MKQHIPFILSAIALLSPCLPAQGWEKLCEGVSVDASVYDFGDILLGSGPVSCRFTLRNDSGKSLLIDRVTTSCGCTNAQWSTGPVAAGKTGDISVVYKNDEGAFPFEKSLTVWLSCNERPVYLKIRGVCHAKPVVLEEVYTQQIDEQGVLAVKSREIKCGTLEQGGERSECFLVANLSQKEASLSFTQLPPQVRMAAAAITVPARKTVRVDFSVRADEQLWGKNWYEIRPVVNGRSVSTPLRIWTVTQMNTSALSKEEKRSGARVSFKNSTVAAGKIKQGGRIEAEFRFSNTSQKDFILHKIDTDPEGVTCTLSSGGKEGETGAYPVVAAGQDGILRAVIDTSQLPKGEMLVSLRLVTNSPLRPLIDLFVSGWVE